MEQKIADYLDHAFAPYANAPGIEGTKEELLHDLRERFAELKREGHSDEAAYEATISSIGDVAELAEGQAGALSARKVNLSQRDLRGADLAGTDAHDGRFTASALRGANFSGARLAGSTFAGSDLRDVVFDGADLTGATLSGSALGGASFKGCTLTDTDFNTSDLRDVDFGGQTLSGAVFDKSGLRGTSFKGATLHNVSFRTTVKHTSFAGARMDKVTYAELKGGGANLDDVTII
ncbi:MAG TPA: pentapeptide repeat-containing protein [Candidatus Saccharimonadales bacterium]|nr:pentapeptide repeat-containing protein [Candidatus Saccharimonadales bacterium]